MAMKLVSFFFAHGVRIPLNNPKYCTFLYLQPCREKEEGRKPLCREGGISNPIVACKRH